MMDDIIHRPHGILLVTGPDRLAARRPRSTPASRKINSPDLNILTIEDPVEYQLEGISQVQVNPKIDLTFAAGLRSFLRHDPDVIMVGEIRDRETADVARLKGASEFGRSEMGETSELYDTPLRGVLYALMELEKNVDGEDVIKHLALNYSGYYGNSVSGWSRLPATWLGSWRRSGRLRPAWRGCCGTVKESANVVLDAQSYQSGGPNTAVK